MALWKVVTRSLGMVWDDLVEEICCTDLSSRRFQFLVSGPEDVEEELRQRRCVVKVEPATDGEYVGSGDPDDLWRYVVYSSGRRWRRLPRLDPKTKRSRAAKRRLSQPCSGSPVCTRRSILQWR